MAKVRKHLLYKRVPLRSPLSSPLLHSWPDQRTEAGSMKEAAGCYPYEEIIVLSKTVLQAQLSVYKQLTNLPRTHR